MLDPTPLLTQAQATGPTATGYDAPSVIRFDATSLALWLPSAGVYDLRVRYTPFWKASDPIGDLRRAGRERHDAADGVTAAARSRCSFDLTLARSTSQALGSPATVCAAPPPNAVHPGSPHASASRRRGRRHRRR